MEPGYPVEWMGGIVASQMQATWAPGTPVYGTITGGIKVPSQGQRPIVAYRCVDCSYLESYAGRPR